MTGEELTTTAKVGVKVLHLHVSGGKNKIMSTEIVIIVCMYILATVCRINIMYL